MPRPGSAERIENGSDLVINQLLPNLHQETGLPMQPGYDKSLGTAKETLRLLGFPQEEIDSAVQYGQECASFAHEVIQGEGN